MSTSLEQELATYAAHKAELVLRAEGEWVVIKGARVLDTFHCFQEALKAGVKEFGAVPMLIKEVLKVDRVHVITRFLDGRALCPW